MKNQHLISILCLSLALGLRSAIAQEAAALQDAKVTLPLTELRELWQAADAERNKTTGPKPPINVSVVSGRYQLDLGTTPPKLTAAWNLQQYINTWQLIPLLGGDLFLQSHQPEEASLLFEDGKFALLRAETGPYQLQLEATLSWEALNSKKGVCLCTVDATSHQLEVIGVPINEQLLINGNASTNGVFPLANQAAIYHLTRRPITQDAPDIPSNWISQSETMVRLVNGTLHYTGRVYLSASEGNGLTASLTVPAQATDFEATGQDLVATTMGQREIGLKWNTPDRLTRVVEVIYTQTLPPFSNEWTLGAPTTAETERNVFTLVLPEGLDLIGEGLTLEPKSNLTNWLRERIEDQVVATIEREGNANALVQTQVQTVKEAAPPIIPKATFSTRLVADGSLIVNASYELHHDTSTTFEVTPPTNAELLISHVNSLAIAPAVNNDTLSFPLSEPKKSASKVSFSYTAKQTALNPVTGSLKLTLPQTSLFIDHLSWALSLPDAYEIEAIDGNVERSAAQESIESTIHLVKDLCRNERPSIEVYYKRESLN